MPEPKESRYRIANCLGQNNVGSALADWDASGIRPVFVVFTGMAEVTQSGMISARERQLLPSFMLIGEKFDA